MKDSHANILRAFLAALIQRTKPISAEVQQQLHKIGQILSADPSQVPSQIPILEALAAQQPDLKATFEQVMRLQESIASERSKGIDNLPDVAPAPTDSFSTELENSASSIDHLEAYIDLLTQLQALPEPTLLQRTIQTLLNPDSAKADSDMMSPPPF